MPPKRKRTEGEAEPTASTRSTRSTARSGGAAAGSSSAAKPAATKVKVKAPVKPTAKETSQKKTTAKSVKAKKKGEEPPESASKSDETLEPPSKKGKTVATAANGKPAKASTNDALMEKKTQTLPYTSKKSAPVSVKHSPYARIRMEKLFATYADEEDPSFVGAEGLEKLCTDANISMEGAQPLLLAWLLEASELGKLTKDEWVKGFDALRIDTLDKLRVALDEYEALLLSDVLVSKLPAANKKPAVEPYNRNLNYLQYTADIPRAFLKFYNFIFLLAKASQERNIDIEMAKAFWAALLSSKYPIMNDLIEFINEKGTVKGVNKDLWAMTLDFCRTVKPSLEDYEADGAWPTLLDEFVAWKKMKQTTPPTKVDDNEMEE